MLVIPDREPDYEHEEGNLRIWFDEMLIHCRIFKTSDPCWSYAVLTLDRHFAIVVPEDTKINSFSMLINQIKPGSILPFIDDINDAYWRHQSEKHLMEEVHGTHQD